MTTFKSFNNLVLDIIDYLRLTQPSLDTKPNSVARDLFVDAQSLQLATLYDTLREIASMQSIANITGQDLTNYGSNYGLSRRSGSKSVGTVVFTFRSMDNDVSIPSGSVVRTRSGIPFITVSTITALQSQSNSLKATAARLRQQLDTVGITDTYALEVSVEAQSTGSAGNVAKYSVISHSVPNVNSVTNLASFIGGTNLEDDASFRSRILATFAGANVGTSIGYRSIVLNLADTIDALVIEPGDPLMTRDGTIVTTDSDGTQYVSEPGTGGKVDIYVMGENPQAGIDSFVYNDQSGESNPTDSSNDYILGQSSLTADTGLTLNSRRVATLAGTAEIPLQPVTNIVSVSGSSSGPNFVEQYTDSAGNLKGNYKLTKDMGVAGGSSFGLDKFSWTSSYIELTNESAIKGTFNGLDGLAFTDITKIPAINQEIQVLNENSTVSGASRNYITVLHTPVKTVTRVFNLTTGERYAIVDQNPDGTGETNTSGRIQISGRTLPTASDILQVDYIWVYEFDGRIDFDNFDPADELNTAQDSVEWGFSNYIRDEMSSTSLDAYNNLTVTTQFSISRVLSVNTYVSESSVVQSSGTRKTVVVSSVITNIHYITDNTLSGNPEVYNTNLDDGNFSNKLITLPTDTLAQAGDVVTVVYNLDDIYVSGEYVGKVLNNQITILPYTAVPSGTSVLVNYVANFRNLLPQTNIANLPVSGDSRNSFVSVDGYQPVQNLYSGSTIISNQRRSPTILRVTASSLPSEGTIRMVGTTFNRVEGVFAATANNIIDLSTAIRAIEGSLSTNIYIARVLSVEAVTLTASGIVQTVNVTYDTTNYGIRNSQWDREYAIEIPTLSRTQVQLANTSVNIVNEITTGTILRVTFYYAKESDYEDLFFSRNGSAYSNKRFAYISSVNRLSGMQDSSGTISGRILIDSFNQPLINTSYFVDYNYTAPKDSERITINFEYNKLITDATEAVENGRPITADVLVKAAEKIELDVEAYIIVLPAYTENADTVRQDVADNISATLSANALGTTLDSSDITNGVYNVDGVDRVRITKFNKSGVSGTKLSITAQSSQYLAPGTVTVTVEDR